MSGVDRASGSGRNDVSAADLLLAVWVGGGLLVSILEPSRVATVIEASPWSASHPALLVSVVAVGTGLLIGRFAAAWGPVRISRERARWQLTGPVDRGPALRGSLIRTATAALVASVLMVGATAVISPANWAFAVTTGAAVGLASVVLAFGSQLVTDRGRGNRPWPARWRVPLTALHRGTFAPRDGYAAALGLAVTLMDPAWIDDARIVRWRRRVSAATPSLPTAPLAATPWRAFLCADVRRLRRHPEQFLRWACLTGLAAVTPVLVTMHHVPLLLPAVAAWSAGLATAGGLRSMTNPVLRRAFGGSDRVLTATHSVVPAVASTAAAGVVAVVCGVGAVGGVVLVVGVAVAVIRRSTRPPLPYDSPAVIDGLVTGAAFQPAVVATQLRGLILVVVVGVVAGALG